MLSPRQLRNSRQGVRSGESARNDKRCRLEIGRQDPIACGASTMPPPPLANESVEGVSKRILDPNCGSLRPLCDLLCLDGLGYLHQTSSGAELPLLVLTRPGEKTSADTAPSRSSGVGLGGSRTATATGSKPGKATSLPTRTRPAARPSSLAPIIPAGRTSAGTPGLPAAPPHPPRARSCPRKLTDRLSCLSIALRDI